MSKKDEVKTMIEPGTTYFPKEAIEHYGADVLEKITGNEIGEIDGLTVYHCPCCEVKWVHVPPYSDVEQFFAAPPTLRQRWYGIKNMFLHYILTFKEYITKCLHK